MSTFHSQGPGRDALGRLVQSARRYKWLLAMAVLVGVLLGYGWAARQPTVYEGVSRVRLAYRCPATAFCTSLRARAQRLLSSSAVLQRAVKLSGSRISAETLRQRLEVEVAQEADDADYTDVIAVRIRVVDSTAKGAAQLANAVSLASQQVLAEQQDASVRRSLAALARRQRQLQDQIDALDQRLGAEPGNRRLQANRDAKTRERMAFDGLERIVRNRVEVLGEPAALPGELVHPKPVGTTAIGGLLGLVVGPGWHGGAADLLERSPWRLLEGVEADHRAGQQHQGVEALRGALIADPQPPPAAQPRPGPLDPVGFRNSAGHAEQRGPGQWRIRRWRCASSTS